MTPAYPPAPWRLRGPALIAPVRLRAEAARRRLPPAARAVPAGPGRALGGIVLVAYEAGSTLVYDELVVGCLALAGGRPGLWAVCMWVDDPRSVAGGRSIWGLPKDLAEFERAGVPGDGRVEIRVGGELACAIEARPAAGAPRVPLPLVVPVLGAGGRLALGRGLGRLAPARARIDVPAASPLADLGLAGAHAALAGHVEPLVFPPARTRA